MTFYRLWTGRVLDNPEHIAHYFEKDMEFLISVAQDIDRDTQRIEDLTEKAVGHIEDGGNSEVSDEVKELIGAVFVGDTEWNQPLEDWLPFPMDDMFLLVDSKVHQKGHHIAKRYGKVKGLEMPTYSLPTEYDIDGNPPTHYSDGIMDQGVLAVSILDLEWFVYVSRQAGLDIDEGLVQKAKQESMEYFTHRRNTVDDFTLSWQESLLRNAAYWIDGVIEEYDMRSTVLKKTSRRLKQEADQMAEH